MAEVVFQLKLNTSSFSKSLKDLGKSMRPMEVPIRFEKPKPINIVANPINYGFNTVFLELKKTFKESAKETGIVVGQTLSQTIKDSLEEITKDKNVFSGIFSTLTQPFRDVFTGALQGVGQGFTLPIGQKLGEGIQGGVEAALGLSIGNFKLLGESIGNKITEGVLESLGVETNELLRNIGEAIVGKENIQVANLSRQRQENERDSGKKVQAYQQAVSITSDKNVLQKFKAEEYGITKLAVAIQKRSTELQNRMQAYQKSLGYDKVEENINKLSKKFQTELEKLKSIQEQILTTDSSDNQKISELNTQLEESKDTLKDLQKETKKYSERAVNISEVTTEKFKNEISEINSSINIYEERLTALYRQKQSYKNAQEVQKNLAPIVKTINQNTKQSTSQVFKIANQATKQTPDPVTAQIQKIISEIVKVIPNISHVSSSNTPAINVGNVPAGGKASYDETLNAINLSESVVQKLLEGTIQDDIKSLEFVIHEIIHAFQSNFGELDRVTALAQGGKAAIPFEKATTQEVKEKYKDLPERVEFSVSGYAEQYRQIHGKEATPEEIKYVRDREEDAYIRSLRAVETVATSLRQTQVKQAFTNTAGSFGGKVVQNNAEINKVYQNVVQQIKQILGKFGSVINTNELEPALVAYKTYQEKTKQLAVLLRGIDSEKLENLSVEVLENLTSKVKENIEKDTEAVKQTFNELFSSVKSQLQELPESNLINESVIQSTVEEINQFVDNFLKSKVETIREDSTQNKNIVNTNLISEPTKQAIENVQSQEKHHRLNNETITRTRKNYDKEVRLSVAQKAVESINQIDLLKKKLALQLELPELKKLAKNIGVSTTNLPKDKLINSIVGTALPQSVQENKQKTNEEIQNIERLIPKEITSTKNVLTEAELILPKIQELTENELKEYCAEIIKDYKEQIEKNKDSVPNLTEIINDIEKTRKLFLALSLDPRLSQKVREYLKSKVNLKTGINGVKNQANNLLLTTNSQILNNQNNKNTQPNTQHIQELVAPNISNNKYLNKLSAETDLSTKEIIENIQETIESLKKLGTETYNIETSLLQITNSTSKFDDIVEKFEDVIENVNTKVETSVNTISSTTGSNQGISIEDEEKFKSTAFSDVIDIAQNLNINDEESINSIQKIIKALNEYERNVNIIESRINNGKVSQKLFPEVDTIKKRFLSTLESIPEPIKKIGMQIGTAIKGFLAFQGLNLIKTQLQAFTQESFAVTSRMTSLTKSLELTSGSVSDGAKSFEFIRSESERLSQPLEASIKSFTQLQATAKGTALEGKQTEKIYTALSQAALVYGLNADQVGRAQTAINQIASKGVVSLEELRGQLTEALPGAIQVSARALNITEKQLYNLASSGQLVATDFLPKFAEQLSSETASGVTGASNTATASIQRFKNTLVELQLSAGKVITPAVTTTIAALSASLKFATENAHLLAAAIGVVSIAALGAFVPLLLQLKPVLAFIAQMTKGIGLINMGLSQASGIVAALILGFQSLNSISITLTAKSLKEWMPDWAGGGSDIEKFEKTTSEALSNVEKKVAEVKQNLEKNKPEIKPVVKPPSTGFFDDLGSLAAGTKTKKDVLGDKAEKQGAGSISIVDLITKDSILALPAQLGVLINKTVNQLKTGKFEFYSQSQLTQDRKRIKTAQILATSQNLAGKISEFVLPGLKPSKDLEKVFKLDKKIQELTTRRAAINVNLGNPQEALEAQKRYKDLTYEINNLGKEREKVGAGFDTFKESLSGEIKKYERRVKDTKDPQERVGLEATLANLSQSQHLLNQITAEYAPTDGMVAMSSMLSRLAGQYEEASRQADAFNTRSKINITTDLNKNITTDINASRTATVATAQTQVKALEQQFKSRQTITKNLIKATNTQENQAILQESGLSNSSTVNEIERKINNTQDAKVKQVLEAYLEVRKAQVENSNIELQLVESRKSVFDATEQSILQKIDESSQLTQSKAQETTDARIVQIKRYQQQGIMLEGTAANAINKIQLNSNKANLARFQESLTQLQSKRNELSANEYEKREQSLLTEISTARQSVVTQDVQNTSEYLTNQLKDVETSYAQNQNILDTQRATGIKSEKQYNQELIQLAERRARDSLAKVDAARALPENQNVTRQREISNIEAGILKTRQEAYTGYYREQYRLFDTTLKRSEAAVQQSEQIRQRDALKIQRQSPALDAQIQADQIRLTAKQEYINKELRIERQRNEALRRLAASVVDPRERATIIQDVETSNTEINRLTNERIENEISQQTKSREEYSRSLDIKLSLFKSSSDGVVTGLTREKNAQDAISRSLDSQTKLLQSRKSLLEASSKSVTDSAQSSVEQTNRALELFKKAQKQPAERQTKRREQAERSAAQAELARQGFGSNDELAIVKAKQAAEDALAAAQQANQLKQLELDGQLLDLEHQKEQAAARRMQLEANIAQLKAQQVAQDAQNKLVIATREGDAVKIQEAQSNAQITQLELEVANQRVSETAKELSLQREIAQNQRDVYELNKKSTLEQAKQTEATRESAQVMERAGAAAGTLNNNIRNKGFLKGIQGRYKGGLVSPGEPYLVGENPDGTFNPRTTELFVPNVSGKIINAKEIQKLLNSKIKVEPKYKGGDVVADKPYLVGENPDGTINSLTTELFIPKISGKIINAENTQKLLKRNYENLPLTKTHSLIRSLAEKLSSVDISRVNRQERTAEDISRVNRQERTAEDISRVNRQERTAEDISRVNRQEQERTAEDVSRVNRQERTAEDISRVHRQEQERTAEDVSRVNRQEQKRTAEDVSRVNRQEQKRTAEDSYTDKRTQQTIKELLKLKEIKAIRQRFKGGEVATKTPYLVGENHDGSLNKTTELFIPNVAGTILNAKDTQKALEYTLEPRVARSSLPGYGQVGKNAIAIEASTQGDERLLATVRNLSHTLETKLGDGLQRPNQENSFTLIQQENPADTALKLHRRLLLQK